MKTTLCVLMVALFISRPSAGQQSVQKEKVTVLSIDVRGVPADPQAMANQVRTELEKLRKYNVTDRYEIAQVLEEKNLSMTSCFGKTCLVEVGKLLNSDKMFSGSVERFGKFLTFTYRMLDVQSGEVEKTYVHEFLFLPDELQNMVKLSVADMFRQEVDQNLMSKLSKPYDYDNLNNNPTLERLALDGPRMGIVFFSGDLARRVSAPKSQGGLDCFPVMSQFGYQFEKQYLNEGRMQALVEFIPIITGLDQAQFIPSFNVLHGLRDNRHGWEFAFGPSIYFVTVAKGRFLPDGDWQRDREWKSIKDPNEPTPEFVERLDSRGDVVIRSSFVMAAGRTFKSGKLNIPVNVFAVPSKQGWRYGISVGFNAKKK